MKLSAPIFVIGSLSAVALMSVLVHPYGNVKAAKSSQPLLAGGEVTPAVLDVFERSCQNCHSDKTEWPWYSYIAPTSMMIESDVGAARSRMNLSHWNEYSNEDQQAILTGLAAAVRSREMPPQKYTLIHPASKLSTEERQLIYNWARSERLRLKAPPPVERVPSIGG